MQVWGYGGLKSVHYIPVKNTGRLQIRSDHGVGTFSSPAASADKMQIMQIQTVFVQLQLSCVTIIARAGTVSVTQYSQIKF